VVALESWLEKALKKYKRRKVFVHFHPHAEIRVQTRNVDVDKIVETVRKGKVFEEKCRRPDRVAFSLFFKEGYTYLVIAKAFPNSMQVKTVWKKKGRI
jgi:hypothetical protein